MTIVPNDDENLTIRPSYIWAEKNDGSAFAIRMQMDNGEFTFTFPESQNGGRSIFAWPISPTRIYETGTTADNIHLFW